MSNLLVFILGILVSLPAGRDPQAALRERVRDEMGAEVEVSLRVGADAAKPEMILTFRNWETDAAALERVRFVIPAAHLWKKVLKDERAAAPRVRFSLSMDGDALLSSLQYLSPGMAVEDVEIRAKSLVIRGSVSVAQGYPIPVRIEAVPKIEGDCLSLEVKKAFVFEMPLPVSASGIFSRVAPMLLDLEEMDIDYFIAEEADEAFLTDFGPVIRKWELKKGKLEVSGYYKAERQ